MPGPGTYMNNNNNKTGAGANANSNMNMNNFPESDTFAELVWSPNTGVNVKFSEKKSSFMWEEEGLSENDLNIASLATPHASDNVVDKSSSCTGAVDTLLKQIFEDGLTSNVNDACSENGSHLKTEPVMQSETWKHVETDDNKMGDIKVEKDESCSDPFLENAKVAIFENENEEKGEDESRGSLESCRSANILTPRKRKCSFEQRLILGSKQMKKQADEYGTKTDYSFMNWISNMFKGLKSHKNIYDQKIDDCNETHSLESQETGFQNLFLSLFSPETITRIQKRPIGSSVLAKRCSKMSASLVKQVSLYEGVSIEAPKGMFDTIRRLRLSRSDIQKWMNSQLPVAGLNGFFLRLRVAKCEERAEGSRYYVACITGLQREATWKDLKQPIRVKVGGLECFVESQHVSNCDFKEDELIVWWQKTSKDQRIQVVKDLKSKLAVRRTLGM